MNVKKVDVIHKCFECKHVSSFKIEFDKPTIKNICLCRDCLNDLYLLIGKLIIPKAIENINKKIKIKE